jgi:4-hydroxybenzoate polyprenyltransferase
MAWLSLTRPARSVLLTVPLPLTFYYLRGAWPLPAGDWWAAAGLLLVLAGGFAVNDAADAPYDCGKGTGAIVSGRIPRHAAAVLGVVLMAVGCWLAAALAQRGFAVSLAAVALALLAYDTCSKQLGLLKAAVVGVLVASTYLLARAQVGHWGGERAATIPFFATWMLLSATAYEIYSDVRDRHSDAAGGGGPRAIQSHPRKWMRAADGLMAAGALMLLPPAFLSLNSIYLAATATLVGLSFIGLLRSHKPGTKLCWVVIEFVAVGIAVVLAGAE